MKALLLASLYIAPTLGQSAVPSTIAPSDPPSSLLSDPPSSLLSDPPSSLLSDPPSTFVSDPPSSMPSMGGTLAKKDCYNSTTDINKWLDHSNPFVTKEIIVCPDTTIELGFPNFGDFDPNEQESLTPRRNTVIKCGEDGSKSNNCTIIGGRLQILITSVSFDDDEPSDNIVIQGFKFSSAQIGVLLIDNAGSITFIDCEFVDQVCDAPMSLLRNVGDGSGRKLVNLDDHFYRLDIKQRNVYIAEFYVPKLLERFEEYRNELEDDDVGIIPTLFGMRRAKAKDVSIATEQESNRTLQASGRLLLTMENCLVANNAQAPRTETTNFGFIKLAFPGNDLILKNTTFRDNQYGDPSFSLVGFAVESFGKNRVDIHDSCFIDNNFIGLAPVRILTGGDVNATNNYGTLDSGLTCQFIGVKESENAAPICIEFDRSSCGGDSDEGQDNGEGSGGTNRSSGASGNSSSNKNGIVSRMMVTASLLLALLLN